MADNTDKKQPINKEYLIASLKNFDKEILSKKYGRSVEGLPTGGTTGQVLMKSSDGDRDVEWSTVQCSGEQGEVGKSAFDIAVDNGFEGTEEEWLESLNGADGIDGVSITSIEKIDTNGLVDTYQISFSDESTFDYEVKNGERGIQGLRGEKGEPGDAGRPGVQGIPGEKGDDGYPFLIYKEYDSLTEFTADDFSEIGLMFMIREKDENNSFPIYRYTGNASEPYSYITGLSSGEAIKGDKGDPGQPGIQGVPGENGQDGTTYQPTIGTVNTVPSTESASASVEVDEETKTAAFSFNIPANEVNKLIIFAEQKPTSVAAGTIVMVYEEEGEE